MYNDDIANFLDLQEAQQAQYDSDLHHATGTMVQNPAVLRETVVTQNPGAKPLLDFGGGGGGNPNIPGDGGRLPGGGKMGGGGFFQPQGGGIGVPPGGPSPSPGPKKPHAPNPHKKKHPKQNNGGGNNNGGGFGGRRFGGGGGGGGLEGAGGIGNFRLPNIPGAPVPQPGSSTGGNPWIIVLLLGGLAVGGYFLWTKLRVSKKTNDAIDQGKNVATGVV